MVEQYLRDSITGEERKDLEETMSKKNLIPALMRMEMTRLDSLKQIREKQKEQYQERMNKEIEDNNDNEDSSEQDIKLKTVPKQKSNPPVPVKTRTSVSAIINDEEKRVREAINRI